MSDAEAPVRDSVLDRTPDQILGPFYPVGQAPDTTGDMTHGGKAKGTILYLHGRILNTDGKPLAGARVEIWQANAKGRYGHPHEKDHAPVDPNFTGFSVQTTGADGKYAFKTIRPAAYPAAADRWRPAHIHFSVTGKSEQIVTQMYFKGEDWNERDPWLNSARRKDALITDPKPAQGKEPGALDVEFDVVLARG